jgi:hypothetical protein
MGTTEKLTEIKKVLATCFVNATDKSLAHGLQFKYTSQPVPEEDGWVVSIIVKEAGYGERTIQEFRYKRPTNIDAKNMEYHVILDVLGALAQGALTTWYEVAKMLASDTNLQKTIIDETKKGNISSN